MAFYSTPVRPDQIYHHGILGQKWGIRRFQNKDGTLTAAGKQHYGSSGDSKSSSGDTKRASSSSKKSSGDSNTGLSDKQKKALKIGAAATATALAAVGTAYLVKSGKASAAVKAGKKITESTISKGKKAVDKVVSKTSHGKFMKMSEKEIDSYIDRMSKVKKAMDLKDNTEHPLIGRAKKIVTKTAETAATGAAAYLVGTTVDKRLDKNQLGDYMRRGGAKKK